MQSHLGFYLGYAECGSRLIPHYVQGAAVGILKICPHRISFHGIKSVQRVCGRYTEAFLIPHHLHATLNRKAHSQIVISLIQIIIIRQDTSEQYTVYMQVGVKRYMRRNLIAIHGTHAYRSRHTEFVGALTLRFGNSIGVIIVKILV